MKTLSEIKKQIEENPLTREQSRAQFIKITNELGLKHSFDFDEVWDVGLEIRRRNDFRKKIN